MASLEGQAHTPPQRPQSLGGEIPKSSSERGRAPAHPRRQRGPAATAQPGAGENYTTQRALRGRAAPAPRLLAQSILGLVVRVLPPRSLNRKSFRTLSVFSAALQAGCAVSMATAPQPMGSGVLRAGGGVGRAAGQ